MQTTVESRALQSCGTSGTAIYAMVRRLVEQRISTGSEARFVDVGCGIGNLFSHVKDLVASYEGVDVIRYDGFPKDLTFHQLDLDSGKAILPDKYADFVVAVETIEHLENPRALIRELVRLCKPGGWIIVTTPNQLSMLSKLTLLLKNQFNAFTDTNYPAHITALLEIDLRRMAKECSLQDISIDYTRSSRIPGTALHWPKIVSALSGRLFSDNIAMIARVPNSAAQS